MPFKPGNILLVANFESNVGYAWWLMETFWVEIAKHFSGHGRQTYLIYPKINQIPMAVTAAPVKVLEYDFADRSKASLQGLKKLIRQYEISSVYLTDQRYYDWLYAALRLWGVRRIVLHDHSPGERPPNSLSKKLFKQLVHAATIFSCDHYIGVSRFVHDRFITRGEIPRRRCSYVLNGIEPIAVRPEWQDYTQQQFSIPKTAIIVVTTGRASRYKGIDFIIRCANHLIHVREHENIYFLHCGDGPDRDLFVRMIAEHRLERHFILAGRRSDIGPILQSCHVALHASHGEAFSLSVLEYMSAGLATLAPQMCGNGEAIENGVTGYLYPPGNLLAVTDLVESLAMDDTKRCLIGKAARQRVAGFFTLDRMKEEFVQTVANYL